MGRVYTDRMFEKDERIVDYLKENYGIEYTSDRDVYEEAVVDDIMVTLKIENLDNFLSLKISKLVSLKAFLLSKEQGMDINDLVYNIDRIMDMSEEGLITRRNGILYDKNLKRFFEVANMKVSGEIVDDGKRKARIKLEDDVFDFNTIEEITE